MPNANVVNATLKLLVMMALDARGLIATMEWVHISWRSIVSTISGPSTLTLKLASWRVNGTPTAADTEKIRNASSEYAKVRRNTCGYVSRKKWSAAAGVGFWAE